MTTEKEFEIVVIIQKRQKELSELKSFWEYCQRLNENHPLKEDTLVEIRTKVSSKMAQLEKSILDHEKLLPTTYNQ